MRYTILILFALLLFSCSTKKDDNGTTKQINITTDDVADTVEMTAPEAFASTLVNDILQEDDEDLQSYLESDIWPLVSKSPRVTMDKVSASIYLLEFEDNGTDKYFMIQKCYSPVKDEIIYVRKETSLTAIKQFTKQ